MHECVTVPGNSGAQWGMSWTADLSDIWASMIKVPRGLVLKTEGEREEDPEGGFAGQWVIKWTGMAEKTQGGE